ncbi:hypothetical protein H1235_03995 [Pseudoxanthomonas sp. NC8]|nr:hypothetical protein H1235_03995 [Pseudoxanthomonas sp. NC8]
MEGGSFSLVYAFNLLGCTIGPALVALLTLDLFSTRDHFIGIAALSMGAAAAVGWATGGRRLLFLAALLPPWPRSCRTRSVPPRSSTRTMRFRSGSRTRKA